MAETLRCKPEGHGGIFHLLSPSGRTMASKRNDYQECFLGCNCGRHLGLTNLPPVCADCLEIWEPQPNGTLMYGDCITF